MKATIVIPDALYRQVKAKSALEGRRVREVTITLYEQWLHGGDASGAPQSGNWLDDLLAHAIPAETPGPIARDILGADRERLDPGRPA